MKALIEEIEGFGSGCLATYGGKYLGGIHLAQVPKEIAQCIDYIRNGDELIDSYLEIGSLAGGTAYVFDRFFDIDTMVLIDDNSREQSKLRDSILADVDYIEFIGNSQSREAFEFVNNLNRMFGVVFIDADHEYDGVSHDVMTYSRFVSPGGYLILHDTIGCPGVKRVFGGMKASGNFTSVVEFADYDHWRPCGIGVVKRHG